MMTKLYEVTCDYCGNVINHYIGRKPQREELEGDGAVCTPYMQFCGEECYAKWKRYRYSQMFGVATAELAEKNEERHDRPPH